MHVFLTETVMFLSVKMHVKYKMKYYSKKGDVWNKNSDKSKTKQKPKLKFWSDFEPRLVEMW